MSEDAQSTVIQQAVRGHLFRKKNFKLIEKSKKRRFTSKEIISTELVFRDSLIVVVEKFLKPMKTAVQEKKLNISDSVVKDIFINIESISDFHNFLYLDLIQLSKSKIDSIMYGSVFIKMTPFLKMYTLYCQKYEASMKIVSTLREKNKKFRRFLEDSTERLSPPEPLESFLIRPIQRIPRYKLLLQDLMKNTVDYHPDKAVLEKAYNDMLTTANFVNSSVHTMESIGRLAELPKVITGYDRPIQELIVPTRVLVFEKAIIKISRNKSDTRHGILFNDLLVMTTKSLFGSKLEFHNEISLLQADVKPIGAVDGKFLFILFTPQRSWLFDAGEEKTMNDWVLLLEKYISETTTKERVKGSVAPHSSGILKSPLPFRPPKNASLWKTLLRNIPIPWEKMLVFDDVDGDVDDLFGEADALVVEDDGKGAKKSSKGKSSSSSSANSPSKSSSSSSAAAAAPTAPAAAASSPAPSPPPPSSSPPLSKSLPLSLSKTTSSIPPSSLGGGGGGAGAGRGAPSRKSVAMGPQLSNAPPPPPPKLIRPAAPASSPEGDASTPAADGAPKKKEPPPLPSMPRPKKPAKTAGGGPNPDAGAPNPDAGADKGPGADAGADKGPGADAGADKGPGPDAGAGAGAGGGGDGGAQPANPNPTNSPPAIPPKHSKVSSSSPSSSASASAWDSPPDSPPPPDTPPPPELPPRHHHSHRSGEGDGGAAREEVPPPEEEEKEKGEKGQEGEGEEGDEDNEDDTMALVEQIKKLEEEKKRKKKEEKARRKAERAKEDGGEGGEEEEKERKKEKKEKKKRKKEKEAEAEAEGEEGGEAGEGKATEEEANEEGGEDEDDDNWDTMDNDGDNEEVYKFTKKGDGDEEEEVGEEDQEKERARLADMWKRLMEGQKEAGKEGE